MTDLVLVRHGETEWNRTNRVQGLTDIPLNETGRRQAREAGRRLAAERWDAIVASPLSRAAETARIIADEVGLPGVELVDALVERNYGEAEGMTGPEIDARWGGRLEAQESREQVLERVKPALLALAERHPDQRVLVVSHGGVIGSVVRDATRWVWPEHGVRIENGSDHVFRVTDGELELVSFAGRPWSADLLPPAEPVRTRD
ncbi:histidine phosphatase family protein [Amnibacterium sp. CER49]|uniref:histidine phosphatase family protein n=1 Tax=Amnibacterium sp. CER49 TaxID=3039161 RepID=UPI0024471888|nr:histidine phosphatase family protein [Amnibacterium sp. CER49]MDH2444447.1 histidine phosphatase family protein [Amnibacterium sp. CER49]